MDKIWIKKKVLSEWIEKERKNMRVKSKKKKMKGGVYTGKWKKKKDRKKEKLMKWLWKKKGNILVKIKRKK